METEIIKRKRSKLFLVGATKEKNERKRAKKKKILSTKWKTTPLCLLVFGSMQQPSWNCYFLVTFKQLNQFSAVLLTVFDTLNDFLSFVALLFLFFNPNIWTPGRDLYLIYSNQTVYIKYTKTKTINLAYPWVTNQLFSIHSSEN